MRTNDQPCRRKFRKEWTFDISNRYDIVDLLKSGLPARIPTSRIFVTRKCRYCSHFRCRFWVLRNRHAAGPIRWTLFSACGAML
jgi:hypothetical protein